MYFVQSNIRHVSGFWGLRSQTLTGALPLDPAGDFRTQIPSFVPRSKFLSMPLPMSLCVW